MKLYGIKNCSSVQKARNFFKEHSIEYAFIDLKTQGVDEPTIRRWLAYTDLATLLNTRGKTYRELGIDAKTLSDEEKIGLLVKHPMLLKRPVIELKEDVVVGFNEELYKQKFLG